jgi:hypothetical protein
MSPIICIERTWAMTHRERTEANPSELKIRSWGWREESSQSSQNRIEEREHRERIPE